MIPEQYNPQAHVGGMFVAYHPLGRRYTCGPIKTIEFKESKAGTSLSIELEMSAVGQVAPNGAYSRPRASVNAGRRVGSDDFQPAEFDPETGRLVFRLIGNAEQTVTLTLPGDTGGIEAGFVEEASAA